MTPQETHAAVVSLLQQQGLPLTTANLNRGMLALAQNDMSTEGAALPAVNRSMDRTMGAAQQAASPPPLPTPPVPPTTVPPQQQAATTLELNTPGTLSDGVRNSVEAFLADKGTQAVMPDGSASSTVAAPQQPMRDPRQFSTVSDQMSDPTIAALAPYRLPESPDAVDMASMVLGGPTGIAPNLKLFLQRRMLGAPTAMRSGQEALTYNAAPRIGYDGNTPAMVTGPKSPPMLSPPSAMANPEGFGYEAALEARRLTGQRAPYLGEGSDHFIKGGNTPSASSSAPASSVKTNTPTWKGESDPSAPMGKGSTTTPSTTEANTATPRSGGSTDTAGAASSIKQSLTKRKQMAASKSTRKSEK